MSTWHLVVVVVVLLDTQIVTGQIHVRIWCAHGAGMSLPVLGIIVINVVP